MARVRRRRKHRSRDRLSIFHLSLSLFLLWACLVVSGATAGPSEWTSSPKVMPRLLAELDAGGEADVLVFVRGRPDLTPARALPTKKAKGRFVVNALRATAEQTQAGLRRLLDTRGVDYQAFWIVNMLRVQADRALVSDLATRPEVKKLDINLHALGLRPDSPNPKSEIQNPKSKIRNPKSKIRNPKSEIRNPKSEIRNPKSNSPWGVANIGAPLVWERGIRGQGIVVAGNDTGVDWGHDALIAAYRGWNGEVADHNYNWHDAWDKTPREPTDDMGHGTHTIGTVAGGGAQPIGVAPDARWIACRNMDRGYGTPASYVDCFQFFLAPTDLDNKAPRPDLAPHVINNSWACIESEGCHPDDPLWEDTIRPAVEALTAAGIAVVVSAGNSGTYGCRSVQFPPAIYPVSFSIGAVEPGNRVANFSSRGPISIDDSDIPAPDLVAPGTGVFSSVPGGYATSSGTSMAAPHVAGTIALLWSAESRLIGRLAVTEQVLWASATPVGDNTCGGDSDGQPNNVYGWGVVNADAAVRTAETLSELSGTVTDAHGTPLPDAGVQLIDLTWGVGVDLATGSDGRYTSPLLPGDYRVVVDTPAHFAASVELAVPADSPATYDVALEACVDWNADGRTGVFELQSVAGDWRNVGFDPEHDVNGDGVINVLDLAVLTAHLDEPCSMLDF